MAIFVGLRDSAEKDVSFVFARTQDAVDRIWHSTHLYIDPALASFNTSTSSIDCLAEKTAGRVLLLKYSLNLRIKQGFEHISQLTDNWDTYGAKAPLPTVLEKAKLLSRYFSSEIQPEIQPEIDGSIGLYWDYNDRIFCLQVSDSEGEDEVNFFIEDTSSGERYQKVGGVFEVISAFSKQFLSQINK